MFINHLTLLLLFCFFIFSTHSLVFNSTLTTIETNREWARVKVGVNGGIRPYRYFYSELPKEWRQVKNYIYIPRKELQLPMKFPCRLIVKDNSLD